jgi:hypothetical protein
MPAILSEKEQKARDLVSAIGKLDELHVWVVSPPNETKLRIQVLPCCRTRFLSQMHDWGWSPSFVGMTTRTSELDLTACLVEVFELDVGKQLLETLPTAARIPDDGEKK